jgi:hypothetical protein
MTSEGIFTAGTSVASLSMVKSSAKEFKLMSGII